MVAHAFERRSVVRLPVWVGVFAIAAVFAVVCWSGIERLGNSTSGDSAQYRAYVDSIDTRGHLPTPESNYEYAIPPGWPAVGVVVQRAFRHLEPATSEPLRGIPSVLRRLAWLLLVVGGAALVAGRRALSPQWLTGVGLWLLAATWAAAYILAVSAVEPWVPLDLPTLACGVGLVIMSALLAREVWPQRRAAPLLAAGAVAAMPAVFSISLVFHPDPAFGLAGAGACWIAVRAARRRAWTVSSGVAAGIVLGAAALIRQSAPVVIVAVLLAVLAIGRRAARRWLAAAAVAIAAVAGPWWVYQGLRFGNPIQGDLNRGPAYMLDHQPLSFYISFPPDVIVRPYIPHFADQLLPRFHAFLWSDWGGTYHNWATAGTLQKVLASTMSVLGLGVDAAVLGTLFAVGVPAVVRVARRRSAEPLDALLTILTSLFVLSWIAYVAMLVRYPQHDGDPINPHYLLFLAPVSAVLALVAVYRAWDRGGWPRRLVAAWVAAYLVTWVTVLVTAF